MRSPGLFALGALLVVAATSAAVLTSSGWPARLPLHLALLLVAGALWAALLFLIPRLAPRRHDRAVLLVAFALLRLPAWLAPPAHSDDVYRYAWDGRVSRAGINPYRYPPADAALAPLRDGGAARSSDFPAYEREPARPTAAPPRSPTPETTGVFSRINNRDLPTLYPPGAQLFFLVAAALPLSPLASLKLLLGACDLGVLLLLLRLLRRRGLDARWAATWALSPLVAIELSQNAHLDALPILCLLAALDAWSAARPVAAGALLGLSAATKLVALPLLVAFRSSRVWLAAALVTLVVALPFLGAGAAITGSTGEFARRWQSNDGAFALLHAATDRAVCHALAAPLLERDGTPCEKPLDLWPRFDVTRLVAGRDYRAALYPDEISGFAARALCALLLGAVVLSVLLRRLDPLPAAEWILGALLLLTPALKPWYATWLLPLAALSRRPAWIALAALVPLGYVPMAAWLGGAPWRDPVWTRLVEHGACWGLLAAQALGLLPSRRSTGGAALADLDRPAEAATIRIPSNHA